MDQQDTFPLPSDAKKPAEGSEGDKNSQPTKYAWVPQFIARHLRGSSVRARLAKGVVWSVLAGVITRSLFVLLSIVLARMLGETEFGKWGMVQATVAALSVVAGMGIGHTLTKHLAELRDTDIARAGRVFSLGMAIAILAHVAIAVLCACFAGVIARKALGRPEMTTPVALSCVIVVPIGIASVLQCCLAGFEAFRQVAKARAVEMVVTFVAMVALTWAMGLTGAIIGFAFGQVVCLVLFAGVLRGLFRQYRIVVGTAGLGRELAVLWHYLVPSLLSGLVMSPAHWVGLALVTRQPSGYSGMAGYAASQRWRGLVGFLPARIMLVALPVMSQLKGLGDVRRYKKTFTVNMALTLAAGLVVAAPIGFCSRWIMGLYGQDFVDKYDVLLVLLSVAVVQGGLGIFTQLFMSCGKVWWTFWFSVLWAGLLVGGSIWLVPAYGIRGFVWSMLGAYIVSFMTQLAASRILLKGHLDPEVLPEAQ